VGETEDSRWGGLVDARLEALHNEMLPLKPLPQQLGTLINTVERMERHRKEDADACAERDEAQDVRLAAIEKSMDRAAGRRATAAVWVPVLVALITTAGFLLAGMLR
jgi:hypothetical protein